MIQHVRRRIYDITIAASIEGCCECTATLPSQTSQCHQPLPQLLIPASGVSASVQPRVLRRLSVGDQRRRMLSSHATMLAPWRGERVEGRVRRF